MKLPIAVLLVCAAGATFVFTPLPSPSGAISFRPHVLYSGHTMGSVVAADFNKDGRLDVAGAANEEVFWLEHPKSQPGKSSGNGSVSEGGEWRRHVIQLKSDTTGVVWSAYLTPHDVNRDGNMDLLSHTLANGNLAWYESPAKRGGEWKWHRIDNLPGVHCEIVADLFEDRTPRLIAVWDGSIAYYTIPRGKKVYEPWPQTYIEEKGATGQCHYLDLVDVNGDGLLDLGTGAAEGEFLAWWRNPGFDRVTWPKIIIASKLPGATHAIFRDVDGDLVRDCIFACGHAKGVGWLKGPGYKAKHWIETDLDAPHTLFAHDLDRDGDIDLVTGWRGSKRIAWFENDGRGKFAAHFLPRPPICATEEQSANDVRVVDLNKDGRLDIIVAGDESRNVVWYEGITG